MGLLARPLHEMIAIDADYPAQMALRRTLLAERPAEVFAAIPGSEAAARTAALAHVADVLCGAYPHWFARDAGVLHNRLTGERVAACRTRARSAGGRGPAGAGGSVHRVARAGRSIGRGRAAPDRRRGLLPEPLEPAGEDLQAAPLAACMSRCRSMPSGSRGRSIG